MSTPAPILQYTLNNKDLLPAGYTPLAYIEFTGTQHIDTGVKANQNTIATVEVVPTSGSGNILGSRSGPSSNNFYIFYNSSATYVDFNAYDSSRLTAGITYGTKYLFYNSASRRLINSTSTTTAISGSFTTPTNLMLGAKGNDSGVGDEKLKGKVYYCSVSEGNTPKLDLRPARRDSDGVIGMYDLVSRSFKTNSGSGTFIAGPPLAVGKGGGKSLPEEYLLVEYLEGTGTQWIDTGYVCSSSNVPTLKYILDAMATDKAVGNRWWANGIGGGSGITFHVGIGNGSSSTYPFTYGTGVTDRSSGVNGSLNTRYKWELDMVNSTYKVWSENGTGLVNQTFTKATPTQLQNLALFRWRSYSNSGYIFGMKIYHVELYNGTTKVVDLFPVYRKSDGKPGMYDVIRNTFYTNAGSGEFILGPTISPYYSWEPNAGTGLLSPYDSNIYVEPDGSKWIRIYHCSNPANTSNLFSSSDSFNTGVKKNDNAWFAFHMCNYITSGLWELMVKQKTTSSASEYKWRWIQYANPMTCSYSDVHNKISKVLAGQYNNDGANRGGLFSSSSNIRLRYDDNSGGGDWFGVGSWTAYQGGYPAYSATVVTSGYEDVYLRLPINGIYNNVNCIYDSSKGWVASGNDSSASYIEFPKEVINPLMSAKTFSIVFWARIHNTNRHIFLGDGSASYPLNLEWESSKFRSYFSGSPDVHGSHTISANTWYHFAVCVTSSGFVLYVNGEVDYTYSSAPTLNQLTDNCRIGSDSRTTQIYMGADITNFQIFNVALTAAQVKELYGK